MKEMGLEETGILTSCSDYHIFLKLNKTRKDAHKAYLDIVATALEQGIVPRCHLDASMVRQVRPPCLSDAPQPCLPRRDGDRVDARVALAPLSDVARPRDGGHAQQPEPREEPVPQARLLRARVLDVDVEITPHDEGDACP